MPFLRVVFADRAASAASADRLPIVCRPSFARIIYHCRVRAECIVHRSRSCRQILPRLSVDKADKCCYGSRQSFQQRTDSRTGASRTSRREGAAGKDISGMSGVASSRAHSLAQRSLVYGNVVAIRDVRGRGDEKSEGGRRFKRVQAGALACAGESAPNGCAVGVNSFLSCGTRTPKAKGRKKNVWYDRAKAAQKRETAFLPLPCP